jgi:hypothetical protein
MAQSSAHSGPPLPLSLEPFTTGKAAINGELERLTTLIANCREQQLRLAQVRELIAAKLDELQSSINLKRAGKLDQPVSREIGRTKTGSENMAPIARHPSTPPAATITQRYCDLIVALPLSGFPVKRFDGLRPVLLQQSGQRPIREQSPTGLAARAVVGFIVRISYPLHRCLTYRAR